MGGQANERNCCDLIYSHLPADQIGQPVEQSFQSFAHSLFIEISFFVRLYLIKYCHLSATTTLKSGGADKCFLRLPAIQNKAASWMPTNL
jgi:hypothetical protein